MFSYPPLARLGQAPAQTGTEQSSDDGETSELKSTHLYRYTILCFNTSIFYNNQ
jgi:hypothetical protein